MTKFKVGDRVRIVGNTSGSQNKVGELGIITWYDGGSYFVFGDDTRKDYSCWTQEDEMQLINDKEGEKGMSEETKTPKYIIITRNTDMFKKGGVFEDYTSFWAPRNDAYINKPYDTEYITPEHGNTLLEKGIAVPAAKFDPEYVTLEQNEVLQKALQGVSKKPSTKKKGNK